MAPAPACTPASFVICLHARLGAPACLLLAFLVPPATRRRLVCAQPCLRVLSPHLPCFRCPVPLCLFIRPHAHTLALPCGHPPVFPAAHPPDSLLHCRVPCCGCCFAPPAARLEDGTKVVVKFLTRGGTFAYQDCQFELETWGPTSDTTSSPGCGACPPAVAPPR